VTSVVLAAGVDDVSRHLEIVGLIYDAALDARVWPTALKGLADFVGGTSATLLYADPASAAAAIWATTPYDDGNVAAYHEQYFLTDVRLHAALRAPVGGIVTNTSLMPHDGFPRTEFYADFLPHLDLDLLGTVLLREEGAVASVGIHRPRGLGDYRKEECRRYEYLVPHLRRAIGLHRRLSRADLHARCGAEALDRLAMGALLIDATGRAVLVNKTAREILDARDGLALSRDGLHASRSDLSSQLRGLIADARSSRNQKAFGGVLSLPRPSLKRPLQVRVLGLRSAGVLLEADKAVVLVFVSDPERSLQTTPELIRQVYGLTEAESRLASLLVGGRTVAEAAEELEISRHTARTQLKAVFQKTGAGRQSELVRLIMNGIGRVRMAADADHR
jgi:DNA-binding CsgD family transcriptional regulator